MRIGVVIALAIVAWLGVEQLLKWAFARSESTTAIAPIRRASMNFARLIMFVVICSLASFALAWPISSCPQRGMLAVMSVVSAAIAVLVGFWMLHRAYQRVRNSEHAEAIQHYHLLYYANPEDKRFFVPKLAGVGWTINMAHPKARWFLVGFMAYMLCVVALIVICAVAFLR